MTERLICLLVGYVFGLFQTSYIIGKMHKTDIREHDEGYEVDIDLPEAAMQEPPMPCVPLAKKPAR